MRVFVAGATGAVGSRLTRLLVSSGHSVVGLTRTPVGTEAIERVGAEASVADALNRAAIVAGVTRARPDVIVHEMTWISAANDLRRFDRSFAATNRLRSQGLVAVAMAGGRLCISTMRRLPPPSASSAMHLACTTLSTTSRLPSASGCRHSPRYWVQNRPGMSRNGSPASPRARTS